MEPEDTNVLCYRYSEYGAWELPAIEVEWI